MWDMQGLEYLYSVDKYLREHDDWEKAKIWATLKDEKASQPPPPRIPLNMMILRARYNSQRCYEIYEFDSGMSADEVRDMFKSSPQNMATTIRKVGIKIFSDYDNTPKQVIF